MNYFLCLLVLFCFGSISGWILELFYRRFVSSKKWINPGFLTGPFLPIYGFGVVFLFLVSYIIKESHFLENNIVLRDIIVIIIMTILMTLVELIAGLIFIKGMNIKLWDYSKLKFNYKGIICPLFSIIWGAIGALFYFVFYNLFIKLLVWFNTTSVEDAMIPFILGIIYGILFVDMWMSFKISNRIKKFAKENKIVVRFEEFKEQIRDSNIRLKQKVNFISPFKSLTPLSELLKEYKEKHSKKN